MIIIMLMIFFFFLVPPQALGALRAVRVLRVRSAGTASLNSSCIEYKSLLDKL